MRFCVPLQMNSVNKEDELNCIELNWVDLSRIVWGLGKTFSRNHAVAYSSTPAQNDAQRVIKDENARNYQK